MTEKNALVAALQGGPAAVFAQGDSRFNQSTMDIGGMPWITMSVKGSKFTLRAPDGNQKSGKVGAPMRMVLLARAEHVNRTYYKNSYVEGSTEAPTCFATNGISPHPSAQEQQADNCNDCPQHVKGSGDDNESRACGFTVPVIGVPVDKSGNIVVDSPFIWRLNSNIVFGASIPDETRYSYKDLQSQLRQVAPNVPVAAFLLEATFDEVNDGMNKVLFQPLAYLTQEQALQIENSDIDAEQMLNDIIPIMPANDGAVAETHTAAPDKAPTPAATTTAPTTEDPAEEQEQVDATPEPQPKESSTKKKATTKAKTTPKKPAEKAEALDPATEEANAALARAAAGEGAAAEGSDDSASDTIEEDWDF